MSIKIGINGFGRIGRLVMRAGLDCKDIEFTAVNDPFIDSDYMAYMLKYDSAHGHLSGHAESKGGSLYVNGKKAAVFAEKEPADISWDSTGAEYIVESTGVFTRSGAAAPHLRGSVKKVVITGPSVDAPMFVMGVNNEKYTSDLRHRLKCLVHNKLPCAAGEGYQRPVWHHRGADDNNPRSDSDPENSRWAVKERLAGGSFRHRQCHTGIDRSSESRGNGHPQLNGKLTGIAMRVPIIDVSAVDLTVRLHSSASYQDICDELKKASISAYEGIIKYVDEDVVSTDFIGDTHTCIFDARAGLSLNDRFVKLIAWYDNEMGYSSKVLDLIRYMHSVDMDHGKQKESAGAAAQ